MVYPASIYVMYDNLGIILWRGSNEKSPLMIISASYRRLSTIIHNLSLEALNLIQHKIRRSPEAPET